MQQWGSTGVLEVLSACVALRPPLLCFPVANLVNLAPLTASQCGGSGCGGGSGGGSGGGGGCGGNVSGSSGVGGNGGKGAISGGSGGIGGTSGGGVEAPLRDCLQMRPLSSVGDVFLAAKRTHPPLCAAELRMFLPDGL